MLSAGSNESKPFAPRKESHFTRTHTPTQSLGVQTHNKRLRYREFRGLKEGLVEKPRLAQSVRLLDEKIT